MPPVIFLFYNLWQKENGRIFYSEYSKGPVVVVDRSVQVLLFLITGAPAVAYNLY